MKHIEIFEDERASKYDEFIQKWVINYQFVIDTIPKIVKMEHPNAKEILVVGCGTGNEMNCLVTTRNNSWNITGIDPSPDMVKIAKQKLKKYPRVTIIQGEINQLSINKKYDVATLLLVLHFMKNNGTKQALLQSVSDKLKQGATLILLDIFGNKTTFLVNLKLMEQLLPKELEGMIIKERLETLPERVHPISEKRLSELLQKTGFSKPIRFFQSAIYGGWIVKKL